VAGEGLDGQGVDVELNQLLQAFQACDSSHEAGYERRTWRDSPGMVQPRRRGMGVRAKPGGEGR